MSVVSVAECDRVALIMRKPCPSMGCFTVGGEGGITYFVIWLG